MSIFKNIKTSYADTFNIDAFGRLRTSELTTQFDGKQLHDNLPLFYDSETIGTSSITHSTANAESTLSLSGAASGTEGVVFQTKQRFNYQSGKSALGMMTFRNFDSEVDVTKRIGYFNSSTTTPFTADYDGFYIQNDGTNTSFVINKNGSPSGVLQSNWNGDKLDGTGASKIDLQLGTETGNLLFWFQFEWLGVGAVSFGFVVNNEFIQCHREDHITSSGVYMGTPNHSLRYEIRGDGTNSGTLRAICSTFNTEGSKNQLGAILSENLGTTHVNANSTSNKYALLGIRLKTANIDTLIDILNYSVLSETADDQLIEVWLNPTVAGTFTFNDISNSSVQIAKGASNGSNTVTSGTLLYSDYVNSQQGFIISVENAVRLGMAIDGTLDEIVLTANPLGGNSDVLASIKWRELS